jgi:hypothetical protein
MTTFEYLKMKENRTTKSKIVREVASDSKEERKSE